LTQLLGNSLYSFDNRFSEAENDSRPSRRRPLPLRDLNPIEQVFSKLKALLRKAGARSRELLWSTIGQAIGKFTPQECRNYIANSGYGFE